MFCVIDMKFVKLNQNISGLRERQAEASTKAKAAVDTQLA